MDTSVGHSLEFNDKLLQISHTSGKYLSCSGTVYGHEPNIYICTRANHIYAENE